MWGWGGHGGYAYPFLWFGAGFRLLVFAALVVGIVYLVRFLVRSGRGRRDDESPLEILKKRYARGEITKEHYEEMKRDVG